MAAGVLIDPQDLQSLVGRVLEPDGGSGLEAGQVTKGLEERLAEIAGLERHVDVLGSGSPLLRRGEPW
jgi:hypothetical protein